jgi:hypothetical protein
VILPFRMARGRYAYRLSAATIGTWDALFGGGTADGAWHAASLATWVPPHARLASARLALTGANGTAVDLRTTGDTAAATTTLQSASPTATTVETAQAIEVETDSARSVDYRITGTANAHLYVTGFVE